MAAQRPERPQPLEAPKRSVHGRTLARLLRRFRIVPAAAPAADLEASGKGRREDARGQPLVSELEFADARRRWLPQDERQDGGV
jgi:hypothetical protein